MSSTDTTQPAGLITIERAVAFVVGPIVIAGSGTLSAWLSTKLGVRVSSSAIGGAFATGGLTAGAAVYKWLDGRSKSTLQKAEHVAAAVQTFLQKDGVPLDVQKAIIHVGQGDLEMLAETAAAKAVAGLRVSESMASAADEVMKVIVSSPIDPAPSTPLPPPPVVSPVAADPPAQPVAAASPLAGPPLPADPPTLQQPQPVAPPQ